LRQSIIHVEQDDIDFDEEELEGERDAERRPRAVENQEDVDEGDFNMTGKTAPRRSSSRAGSAALADVIPAPATPPKKRMIITHDRYMALQSLIVMHLSEKERETGTGLDRDDLIDWYLEQREEDVHDVEELEYEKELVTKMLRKLVKDNYLIEIRGDVQDSLPSVSEESQQSSAAVEGEDVKVYYMVHPSVDLEGSSLTSGF